MWPLRLPTVQSSYCLSCIQPDDFPKPQITVQPETQSAIKDSNVTFVCSAASSSDSPMTFAWKKDNEALGDAEIHNQAHLRAHGGGDVTEYTTVLQLRNVDFSSEGRYQCVISNHFGSSYSVKAKLTVNSKSTVPLTPWDFCFGFNQTERGLLFQVLCQGNTQGVGTGVGSEVGPHEIWGRIGYLVWGQEVKSVECSVIGSLEPALDRIERREHGRGQLGLDAGPSQSTQHKENM